MAPQFKKLTDCPENLREAIDWLIQIKNGGDGKGLENLSQALKKLIDEAIERAYTTNVSALLKALASVKSYTCCKDKVVEIEKLKNPKRLAQNIFDDLKHDCEDIKNCSKNHLDSSQQKAFDDIQSKFTQLENLQKSLNGFTDQKSCETLLTNLCSGLEKFLGFSSDSKGYTGEGIVYSDVDRLCDAVMAFLLGVLEGVKDENEVTTYDNYITPNDRKLQNVLDTLNNKIGTGRTGLVESVAAVKGWLEGYEGGVNQKNSKITMPIYELEKQIKDKISKLQEFVSKKYEDKESELAAWVNSIEELPKKSKKSYEALSHLDGNLKNKLHPHVDVINRFSESFKKTLYNDFVGLVQVCGKVDEEFNGLNEHVDNCINHPVNGLKKRIDNDIQEFQHNLSTKHPKALEESIKNAKQMLTDAKQAADEYLQKFEPQKKEQFDDKIKAIEALLDEIDKSKNTKGVSLPATESKLHGEVSALTGMISEMESQLQAGASKIGNAINVAVQGINLALRTLDEKVKEGLEKMKQQINPEVKKVISALKKGVENVANGDSEGADFRPGEHGAQDIIIEFQSKLGNDAETLYQWGRAAQNGNFKNVLAKLDKHTGSMSTNNYQAFRSFLEQLLQDLNAQEYRKSFFDALIADLKKKVDDKISEIKGSMFTAVFQRYKQETTQGIAPAVSSDEPLHSRIDKIKTTVAQFFEEGKIKGIDDKFNLGQQGPFGEYHTKMQAALSAIRKALSKITTLENIPGAVKTARQKVGEFIEEIRSRFTALNTKAEEALRYVEKAEQNLEQMLQCIYDDIKHYHRESTYYIDQFHDVFIKRSTIAQTEIKKEAFQKYVQSNTIQLTDLQQMVEKERQKIDDTITKDVSTGVKGLMGEMYFKSGRIDALTNNSEVKALSDKYMDFMKVLSDYITKDIATQLYLTKETKHKNVHYNRVDGTFKKLKEILEHLKAKKHYDHKFTRLLAELQELLAYLHPSSFAHIAMPVVAAIKGGVTGLTNQLQTAYVLVYDGEKIDWTNDEKSTQHCAKAFVTLMYTLYQQLHEVYYDGGTMWKAHRIRVKSEGDEKRLQTYFTKAGYETHHLINEKNIGWEVAILLKKGFGAHKEFNRSPNDFRTFDESVAYFTENGGLLSKLFGYLEEYNDVSHMTLRPKPRHPSSVYDALVWLTGLPHTRVRSKMLAGPIQELFENPDDKEAEGDDGLKMSLVTVGVKPVEAHPKPIVYDRVSAWLDDMCSKSYDLLICIVGPGDAATYYGCDYCNNALNLYYPADAAECFDLMCDMLGRIYSPLKFLYQQCRNSSSEFGWSDCLYGRDVALTKWHCGQHSSVEVGCQANGQPNCQSKCEPTCRPTSPLMSYLNDALPGHLPHKLSAVGCKYKCSTCSSGSRSMPCLTPLGFRAFSGSTRKGEDICSLLKEICGDDGVLTSLVSSLTCLVGGPPKTLPDIFTFYYNIIKPWMKTPANALPTNIIQNAISDKILETVGCKHDDAVKLLDSCQELCYSTSHSKHNIDNPDLKYLAGCGTPNCGAFFLTLNSTAYSTFAPKHAGNYLSWLLYSAWSLVDFIDQLKNAFCSISCYNSDCRGCLNDANCQQGKHGNKSCGCQSIVHCTGVSSVFYKCGLQFVDIQTGTRKKCFNLREALEKLLSSDLLNKFLNAIDQFLWKIREPFSYLVLTLWLLSLFYLLHIMLIRLDLLHIKSHLHSPSSHRIAAQSLLAAGRVGKLSTISYLQA
ncbi:hypothetical protein BBBOND_0304230 [Babesia bigemina]|uniref:C3H1-type domain-containing protein n=1 Tax=Babesia bigemina TaxID=5866 RepID=A0A061DC53_BABBI|nr:hypothetical protein BBBOND_0304230 [Babesia bigemina]CDR96519.1 hypothetical protein BBBOND_0304230 [Babesia bigemina]|eukprot:XP_012768705.1 hypothetical protein BBBOND_0304230 [Babesia bigemina]